MKLLKTGIIALTIFVVISDVEILYTRYSGYQFHYLNYCFVFFYAKINPKPAEITEHDYYTNYIGSNTVRKIIQDSLPLPYQVQIRPLFATLFLVVLAGVFLFLFIRTLIIKSAFQNRRKILLPVFFLFFVWLQFLAGQSLSFAWVSSPDREGNYTGEAALSMREYYSCIPFRSKHPSILKNTDCDDIGSETDRVRCFGFNPTREQECILFKRILLSDADAMYVLDGFGFFKLKTQRSIM